MEDLVLEYPWYIILFCIYFLEKKEVKKINIYDEEENNRINKYITLIGCKDCYRIFSEFPNAKIAFERCLQTCIRESCDICNYIAILVSETYGN